MGVVEDFRRHRRQRRHRHGCRRRNHHNHGDYEGRRRFRKRDVTVKPLDPATVVQFDLDSAISAVNEATTENLPLISTGSKYGSTITWTSSNENVITGTDTNYQAPSADPLTRIRCRRCDPPCIR